MNLTTEGASTAPSPEAEDLARQLHAAFLRLSPRLQARYAMTPTGNAAIERPMLIEAGDGSDYSCHHRSGTG